MSCERYWSDGVVLVEQGVADTHRETCDDCQRAHRGRAELVAALPFVGIERTGDSLWKQKVWAEIERQRGGRRVGTWWIASFAAAAAVVVAVWWGWRDRGGEQVAADKRNEIEIVQGQVAMRSQAARVGDRIRVNAEAGEEVRVYRAEQLVSRCAADAGASCRREERWLVSEIELSVAGEYAIVVLSTPAPAPLGSLDSDLAAVVTAGGKYRMTEMSVR